MIVKYLEDNGPKSIGPIMEHINDVSRHGTTMQQIINVLGKNAEFEKVGSEVKGGLVSGHYDVVVWGLSDY